jgi:hypothetical protein
MGNLAHRSIQAVLELGEAMNKQVMALGLYTLSLCAAIILAYAFIGYLVQQNERKLTEYIYEQRGEEDLVAPQDISAMHEEVRRIQREADQ